MDPMLQFLGNHPLLSTALAVILVLLVLNEFSGRLTGDTRLSPLEAVRLINDRDAIVLDLRSPGDYKKGHILNAVNVPQAKVVERLDQIAKDRGRPVVLVCALGGVAAQAAQQLRKSGWAEVFPVRGGLNAWLGASLPVTTRG